MESKEGALFIAERRPLVQHGVGEKGMAAHRWRNEPGSGDWQRPHDTGGVLRTEFSGLFMSAHLFIARPQCRRKAYALSRLVPASKLSGQTQAAASKVCPFSHQREAAQADFSFLNEDTRPRCCCRPGQ